MSKGSRAHDVGEEVAGSNPAGSTIAAMGGSKEEREHVQRFNVRHRVCWCEAEARAERRQRGAVRVSDSDNNSEESER